MGSNLLALGVFLHHSQPYILRYLLLLNLELGEQLEELASNSQGSCCFYLPRSGGAGAWCSTQLFYMSTDSTKSGPHPRVASTWLTVIS